MVLLLLLVKLRQRHKVYKPGSIGDFEFDAFISYGTSPDFEAGSEEDPEESFVRRLIEDLELGEGDIKISWHRRDFDLGENVQDNIRNQMSKSRCILFVASRNSLQSFYCNTEIEKAMDLDKKRIVVMRIGDNAPTEEQIETTNPELRRLISTETYLEEESDMAKKVERLRAELLKIRDLKEDKF